MYVCVCLYVIKSDNTKSVKIYVKAFYRAWRNKRFFGVKV